LRSLEYKSGHTSVGEEEKEKIDSVRLFLR